MDPGLVAPAPPDPQDGRVCRIRLTERGVKVWSASTARRTRHEARLFADLDSASLAQLNDILSRLLDRFERELGTVSRHDRT